MRIKTLSVFTGLALSVLLSSQSAQAAYAFDGSILPSPASVSYSFNSGSSAATLSFDLIGYLSLDGNHDGGFEDFFTLKVNGTDVFAGSFSLGGQGDNIYVSTGSTSYVSNYVGGTFSFAGGSLTVTLPVALNVGSNTLTFQYDSAIAQGTGDEGWGVKNITVTAVPEPETYALMLAGLGLLGFSARRKFA